MGKRSPALCLPQGGTAVNLESVCSQTEFGALVGVSQQAVSEMLARGVLTAGQSAAEWLLDYCANLREQAAGRGADGELAFQRSELARVSRERNEIKLSVERREYGPVALLEQVLATVGRNVAGTLEPLHVSLHKRCPALGPEDVKFIQNEISKACDLAVAAALSILDVPDEDAMSDDTAAAIADDEELTDEGRPA